MDNREDEHPKGKQLRGRETAKAKRGGEWFLSLASRFFFFSSSFTSSQPQPSQLSNSKTLTHNSGRCRYVPILGLVGVLLCLAGLAIYAGGAVPAGRTIAALVSKVDTKTSAASPSSSSSGGEENSTSPPRPTGRGPLSRLVEAYIATTTVGFTHGLNFLREEAEVGKKMNRRRKRKKTHRFFFLFIKKTGLRRCGHHHRRSRSRGARREGEAAGGARRALRERLRLGLREREQWQQQERQQHRNAAALRLQSQRRRFHGPLLLCLPPPEAQAPRLYLRPPPLRRGRAVGLAARGLVRFAGRRARLGEPRDGAGRAGERHRDLDAELLCGHGQRDVRRCEAGRRGDLGRGGEGRGEPGRRSGGERRRRGGRWGRSMPGGGWW